MNSGLAEIKASALFTPRVSKEMAGVWDWQAFEAFPALKICETLRNMRPGLKKKITLANILLGFLESEKRRLN